MERRKLISLRPQAEPGRVRRGARLASDSEMSPEKTRPETPKSVSPLPPPILDLGRSAPTPHRTSSSPSLPKKSHLKSQRRPPSFRRRFMRASKATGAKLDPESDSSPDKSAPSNPRSIGAPTSLSPSVGRSGALRSPPPPQTPKLSKNARPPSPPKSSWVDKRLRRLPRYYYRRLPDWCYLSNSTAAVGVAASATAESAQSRSPAVVAVAQIDAAVKATLEDGDDAGIVDGEEAGDEDDDVPWCR